MLFRSYFLRKEKIAGKEGEYKRIELRFFDAL